MAIPKIIHYCWFGGAPKPTSVLRCIDSWRKYCPDFEIREWTEKDFDISQNEYTRQAYEAKAWGFVPDYIRLWIIYHYGGIYLDTDVQIIKDLSPLLENSAFMGFEDASHINLGQGFGAETGNEVILDNMRLYDTLRFINEDGTLNKTPSPIYTTNILLAHGLQQNIDAIQFIDGVSIYPSEYFCPKSFFTGITTVTPNTYSIHQFDASWYTEEQEIAKQARWKRKKREYLVDYIIHIPNRILRKLLGDHLYKKLKAFFGGGR